MSMSCTCQTQHGLLDSESQGPVAYSTVSWNLKTLGTVHNLRCLNSLPDLLDDRQSLWTTCGVSAILRLNLCDFKPDTVNSFGTRSPKLGKMVVSPDNTM